MLVCVFRTQSPSRIPDRTNASLALWPVPGDHHQHDVQRPQRPAQQCTDPHRIYKTAMHDKASTRQRFGVDWERNPRKCRVTARSSRLHLPGGDGTKQSPKVSGIAAKTPRPPPAELRKTAQLSLREQRRLRGQTQPLSRSCGPALQERALPQPLQGLLGTWKWEEFHTKDKLESTQQLAMVGTTGLYLHHAPGDAVGKVSVVQVQYGPQHSANSNL